MLLHPIQVNLKDLEVFAQQRLNPPQWVFDRFLKARSASAAHKW